MSLVSEQDVTDLYNGKMLGVLVWYTTEPPELVGGYYRGGKLYKPSTPERVAELAVRLAADGQTGTWFIPGNGWGHFDKDNVLTVEEILGGPDSATGLQNQEEDGTSERQ